MKEKDTSGIQKWGQQRHKRDEHKRKACERDASTREMGFPLPHPGLPRHRVRLTLEIPERCCNDSFVLNRVERAGGKDEATALDQRLQPTNQDPHLQRVQAVWEGEIKENKIKENKKTSARG